MDSNKGQIFNKSDLSNPGKLLFKSSASKKDDTEVQIDIYEKGLVETSSKNDQKRSFEFSAQVS